VLAGTWLIAGLATIALPGLSGFVPEYLVLLGTFRVNIVAAVLAVLAVIIAALYILLPYQRIFTGPRNETLAALPDLGAREKWVVAPLVAAMLALGVVPGPVMDVLRPVAEEAAIEQPSSVDGATGAALLDGSSDAAAAFAEGSEK